MHLVEARDYGRRERTVGYYVGGCRDFRSGDMGMTVIDNTVIK